MFVKRAGGGIIAVDMEEGSFAAVEDAACERADEG